MRAKMTPERRKQAEREREARRREKKRRERDEGPPDLGRRVYEEPSPGPGWGPRIIHRITAGL